MDAGSKVLCPTLDIMLKKTILALCEVNIKYDYKLEICGSLHIRSDDQKVLTCLMDEKILGQCTGGNNILGLDGLIKKNNLAVQPIKLSGSQAVDLSYGEKETLGNSINGVLDQKSLAEDGPAPMEGDMIEVSSMSSQYSKSPGAASMENNTHGALDLSNTSESENGQTDSETRSPRMHNTHDLLPPLLDAHLPTMVDAQANAVTQQIAALNQMAEMMQRNMGIVLPSQSLSDENSQNVFPPQLMPGGMVMPSSGPHLLTEPNNNQPENIKMEPAERPSPPTSQQGSIAVPSSPQQHQYPSMHPMMASPMRTAMVAASMALDPLTIGNPVHTKNGVKKWQCVFCGILVSSKFYLSSHINAVHTRTRIYPCEMCGKLFYSHGAQRIHKLRNHWIEKRHKCPQCGQLFVLPFELRQHTSRKHRQPDT